MEQSHVRATWIAVIVLLAALLVGYTLMLLYRGDFSVLAQPVSCPMEEDACINGDCANHEACVNEECGQDCPGNCEKNN